MPLDPVAEAMLKQMAEAGGPAITDVPPTEARAMYKAMQSTAVIEQVHSQEDRSANGVPVRVYSASDEVTPCIVYLHGGGWVIGDLDTHDTICTQLTNATGYTVVSVDYRLAPEDPFPAPLDDSYTGLCWVQENAAMLNIDPSKIAVAGDSAGGNLAAAVCLKARAEDNTGIAFQLLLYPVIDFNFDTQSYIDNAEGYLLTREGMRWFWDHYIGHDNSGSHPMASPIREKDLSGLPPACILTAEFDPLRDEGEVYAAALEAAGVPTVMKRYDGMIHGFFGMTDTIEGARQALTFSADELRKALGH